MVGLTKSEQEAFDFCKPLFEALIQSETYQKWLRNAIEDWGFYEGSENRQWDDEDLKKVQDAKLRPITVNAIKARLNALAGRDRKSVV